MSEDLIKKEEAKEAVCKGCLKDWKICHHHWDCPMLTNLEMLPSADRPQGEWILLEPRYPIEQKVYWNKEQALADTKGNGARERRKCSCCGYTKSFMCHMKDEQIKLWNFCPNCGADMRGNNDE